MYLNPLLLVPTKKVNITEDYESDSPDATWLDIVTLKGFDPEKVTAENFAQQNISFELYLNIRRIQAYYAQLGVAGRLSFAEFKTAFLTKELSQIRYGAVEYMHLVEIGRPYAKNQVWEYLFNLLELRRCAYRLSFEIPAFSRYIDIYNACVRKTISMEMAGKNMERFAHILPEFEKIKAMLETVYRLVIHDETDAEDPLVEYALPFVLSAERRDVAVSAEAAKAVYNYIMLPNDLHKAFGFKFADVVFESEDILEDTLQEERPAISGDEATGFYRDVLIDRMDEIMRIRNVFKRIFTMTEEVAVYDGDVSLKRQQQLYLDSLTGEDGKNFLQRRFKNTTMDVVVLRDISFSTDLNRQQYAEAIVAILAALEAIPAVRTAQIDFSDFPKLNKAFHQPVSKSTILPEAFGATRLAGVLDILQEFQFSASKRLVFLITDGEIEDIMDCRPVLEKLKKDSGLQFFTINITAEAYGDRLEVDGSSGLCSFSMLDKALFQILVKELM